MAKNCSKCAAPLKLNDRVCSYCGTKADLDIRGIHAFTKVEPTEKRDCSKCKTTMDTINLEIDGDFLIEQCPKCYSLFFDPGELEFLLKETAQKPEFVNHIKLNKLLEQNPNVDLEVSYRPCPCCGKIMNRQNYGARSGVIVDYCKEHGVFLDSGELTRLCQWRKAGGQEHDNKMNQTKDELAQKREARRQADIAAAELRSKGSSSFSNYSSSNSSFSSFSGSSNYDITDALSDLGGLVRFVGKLFR